MPDGIEYRVAHLQAADVESLPPAAGIRIEVEPELDEMRLHRVAVIGSTREILIDYIREHWGDEDEDWFRQYVRERVELVPTDFAESLARQDERFSTATKLAIAGYASDEVEIVEAADNRSGWFIESVDGGYWVEARVWVDAQEVENSIAEVAPDEVTLRYVVPVDVIVNVPEREVRRIVVLDDEARLDGQQDDSAVEIAEAATWPAWDFGY
jgi:hypothetical protein